MGITKIGTTLFNTVGQVKIGTSYVDKIFVGSSQVFPTYYYYLSYLYESTTCAVSGTAAEYLKTAASYSVGTGVYALVNGLPKFITVDNSQTGTTALNSFTLTGCSGATPTPTPTPSPTPTPTPTPVVITSSSFQIGTNLGSGFVDNPTACNASGTPLTVWVSGTETDLQTAVITNGKALYTDTTLLTKLNGGGLYFKDGTTANSGNTFAVDSVGAVSTWTACGAANTPTPTPTPSPSPTPTPTPGASVSMKFQYEIDSAYDGQTSVNVSYDNVQASINPVTVNTAVTNLEFTAAENGVINVIIDPLSSGLGNLYIKISKNTQAGTLIADTSGDGTSTLQLNHTLTAADLTGATSIYIYAQSY